MEHTRPPLALSLLVAAIAPLSACIGSPDALLEPAANSTDVQAAVHAQASALHLDGDDPVDISDALHAIDGLDVVEIPAQAPPGYRYFQLDYAQPVNHDQPDGASFQQRMVLLHRSADAPMIFNPQGYDLYVGALDEPTALVAGNQLSVEHRYFGTSVPQSLDWQHLTIEQAAADHHRIVTALRPLYSGAWVSTGVSKGGMTATYHRRFYPSDVDATIAYVAPLSYGPRDRRYDRFLRQVGTAACRDAQRDFQRLALERRAHLTPIIEFLAGQFGTGFTRIVGGVDAAYDVAVVEYLFQFWQYGSEAACQFIPGPDATDDAILNILFPTLFYGTDAGIDAYLPYYMQAATQLGYPRISTAHIDDLLVADPNDYTIYGSELSGLTFDWQAMFDMTLWTLVSSESVIFVYGDIDPWTAGQYPVPPNNPRDVHTFVAPGANHGASIADLADSDRAAALGILEQWTGVTPDLAALAGSIGALGTFATDAGDDARSRRLRSVNWPTPVAARP